VTENAKTKTIGFNPFSFSFLFLNSDDGDHNHHDSINCLMLFIFLLNHFLEGQQSFLYFPN